MRRNNDDETIIVSTSKILIKSCLCGTHEKVLIVQKILQCRLPEARPKGCTISKGWEYDTGDCCGLGLGPANVLMEWWADSIYGRKVETAIHSKHTVRA